MGGFDVPRRPQSDRPNAFAGWMRPLSVYGVPAAAIKIQCGLAAVDHGDNTYRYERTRRDVRLVDVDWYHALFQVAGWSGVTQNEHTVQLAVGDIELVDGARPSTRISANGSQWLSIYLPRQSLISHLGYEPQSLLIRERRNDSSAPPPSACSRQHRRRGMHSRTGRPPHAACPLRSTWRRTCTL